MINKQPQFTENLTQTTGPVPAIFYFEIFFFRKQARDMPFAYSSVSVDCLLSMLLYKKVLLIEYFVLFICVLFFASCFFFYDS